MDAFVCVQKWSTLHHLFLLYHEPFQFVSLYGLPRPGKISVSMELGGLLGAPQAKMPDILFPLNIQQFFNACYIVICLWNVAIVFKSLVLLILFSFLVAFWGDDLPSSSLSCDQSLWVGKFWDTAPLQNYFSPSKIQGDLFKFSTNSWEHKESTCT